MVQLRPGGRKTSRPAPRLRPTTRRRPPAEYSIPTTDTTVHFTSRDSLLENQTGPKPLPSPRSKAVAGLLSRDNIFRPINARYAYGVLPAWKDQANGPETGDLFANDSIRETIMVDLQGFPNDVAAPHAAFRLRAISPWGTCFRESFLKAGSEKAQMQLKQVESSAKGCVDGEPKVAFDGNVL